MLGRTSLGKTHAIEGDVVHNRLKQITSSRRRDPSTGTRSHSKRVLPRFNEELRPYPKPKKLFRPTI